MKQNFDEWRKGLEGLDDIGVARKIRDMILEKNELDETSAKLFSDVFDYIAGKAEENITLKMSDVEEYIKGLGHDSDKVNIPVIFIMLSFCGLFIAEG